DDRGRARRQLAERRGPARVLPRPAARLRDAAPHPIHAVTAPHAHQQGPQARTARAGCDGGHLDSAVTARPADLHDEQPADLPDDIHAIAVPTPFAIGSVNAFVLEGSPLTLIDSGPNFASALMAIEDALAAIGRSVKDL